MLRCVYGTSFHRTSLLKLWLWQLRRQEPETLLERDALLGKLVIRREPRRVRGLRGRTIRGNFLFVGRAISINRRQSSARPLPVVGFFPILHPRSSVTRRTYLERVHALALIVEIIHQIPAFTNRTFVRSHASHRQSFHSFGVEFRSEPPPHSIESIRFDPFRARVRSFVARGPVERCDRDRVRSFVRSRARTCCRRRRRLYRRRRRQVTTQTPKVLSLNPQKLSPEPSV